MSDHRSPSWIQNRLKTEIRVVHVVNNESHQSEADDSDDACYNRNSQHATIHMSLMSTSRCQQIPIVQADSDGSWADCGSVAHCGAFIVVDTAAPPWVDASGAILNETGAEGVHTKSGGTVYIICGESCCCVLKEAKSLEGETGFLLLSIDSYYCLAIPVTPLTEDTCWCFSPPTVLGFSPRFQSNKNLVKRHFIT